MMTLNPYAQEFVPGSYGAAEPLLVSEMEAVSVDDVVEDLSDLSPEELDELETVEDWLEEMAWLEEIEKDFEILFGL
jgi:isopentenyl phosphate kinase